MERLTQNPVHPANWIAALIPARHAGNERMLRKAKLLILFYGVSAIFLAAFAGLYQMIGYPLGVWACTYGACVVPLLLFIFQRTGSFALTTGVFNVSAILMFSLLIYGTGGINSCIVPWLAIIPASGFVFDGWRRGLLMSVVCLAEIVTLYVLEATGTDLPNLYAIQYAQLLNLVVQVGLVAYIFMVLTIYEVNRERTIAQVDALNADLSQRQQEVEQQREALAERNIQIAHINASLEQQVISRTEKLRQAKKELDTFLYEAAHALRRPVARIMGLISILRNEPEVSPSASTIQQYIDTSSQLMDQMLHKLIMVSELDTRETRMEAVELLPLTHQVLHSREAALEAAGVALSVDISPDQTLQTDGFLLGLALGYVLDNAIQYTAKTGRKPVISICTKVDATHLSVQVKDNGLGIPASEVDHVTEMFFRATEKVPGGGLGLYVAQKAMEGLGGTILIESVFGEGTVVSLLVPLTEVSAATSLDLN